MPDCSLTEKNRDSSIHITRVGEVESAYQFLLGRGKKRTYQQMDLNAGITIIHLVEMLSENSSFLTRINSKRP